ncbi:hypothetical protein DFH27DRAFT_528096 [Peziza echinospora]|nr:hypothetical protein DFH27DRAFT_528096 [Peziza echinospora]
MASEGQPPSPMRPKSGLLSLPAEILEQIALEASPIDTIRLAVVHRSLAALFCPDNNLFWFKATSRSYAKHFQTWMLPQSDSTTPLPYTERAELAWLSLMSGLRRPYHDPHRSVKNNQHFFKYDSDHKYFEGIKSIYRQLRGCQVCCIGPLPDCKLYKEFKKKLCHICFDELTINRPKIRFLNLPDKKYAMLKHRRKNGSVQFACWLPDVLRALPAELGATSIVDVERLYNSRQHNAKHAIIEYRSQTRESVIREAVEIYKKEAGFQGFRTFMDIEAFEEYAWGLERIPSVEFIPKPHKKPKTKVWCIDVARKEVLPHLQMVEVQGTPNNGEYRYTLDKNRNWHLVSSGTAMVRHVIVRQGVPQAIQQAAYKYHEERFVDAKAGWAGIDPAEPTMTGTCRICMEKLLERMGLAEEGIMVSRDRKRKRDSEDDPDAARDKGKGKEKAVPEEGDMDVDESRHIPNRGHVIQNNQAFVGPSRISFDVESAAHPPPPAESPTTSKRLKRSHDDEVISPLSHFLPQMSHSPPTTSSELLPDPLRSLRGWQGFPPKIYTPHALAMHYEAEHTERFYSGEDDDNGEPAAPSLAAPDSTTTTATTTTTTTTSTDAAGEEPTVNNVDSSSSTTTDPTNPETTTTTTNTTPTPTPTPTLTSRRGGFWFWGMDPGEPVSLPLINNPNQQNSFAEDCLAGQILGDDPAGDNEL